MRLSNSRLAKNVHDLDKNGRPPAGADKKCTLVKNLYYNYVSKKVKNGIIWL